MTRKKKKTTLVSVQKHIRRHVRLAVVPHAANHYRPHAIRRYGIAGIILFVLAIQGLYNGLTTGAVLGAETQVTSDGLLQATNRARASQGLKALTLNSQLSKAAELKVLDMFNAQYWSHTSPSGTTPWHWFGEVGYAYADAGENLAKNFTTSDGVMAAWLQSPTHRANVLKEGYTEVGFAIMNGTLSGYDTSIVVALYGTPAASTVQGSTTATSITGQPLSLVAQLGVGIQSLTPAAIGSVILLLVGANIAVLAHLYRRKLPAALRRGWYRHHGIYKAVGFVSLAVVVLFAYGGGQL